VQLSESAVDAGIIVLHVADWSSELPGSCRTFAEVTEGLSDGAVNFVRHGVSVTPVELESVTIADAEKFALAMSPCVDQGAVADDATDLPRVVPLLGLLGEDATATPAAVVDRWRETESLVSDPPEPREKSSALRARVGSAGATDMTLDLRSEGPHAFVGGSTGSGKSEFLQSWILGLASEYSPQRVTFLFVDYKASSAFEECVKLPHCVGLVTDLTPHLVSRALTSLRAELRTRQEILLKKKATDLLDLEKRGDPECPPALVIVIDEFAALVSEVPDFVDGVVDIAQRGRALGIHLVMATQRTAGVIKDSIRANANLRVCLRMTEEADSVDVLGSPVAATFDPGLPGRAMAKTGPGRLIAFQSAFAGGTSDTGPRPPDVAIAELRFGAEQLWRRPPIPQRDRGADRGPTDLVRLVATITDAVEMAGVPAPRRPWLGELRGRYDIAALGPRTDSELFIGVADIPERQAQKSVAFHPDSDGHLVVYGTGGSGKTVLLRTLAAGAGVTPKGGTVQVYGLDFASGGLRVLGVLPHVGAVVPRDDDDRVARLFRFLKDELERRKRSYPPSVDSIVAYRAAGQSDEPRILLLLDGYPAFREDYEGVSTRASTYATFMQLLADGRRFGIHVILTADRPGSVPSAVASNIPRRVVLRLSDDAMYGVLDVPKGMLSAESPPGRCAIDELETQIAAPGGSSSVVDQEAAINGLAAALSETGRVHAPVIASLPTLIDPSVLPDEVSGEPLLGVADTTLSPTGFSAEGPLLVAGPPGSGRSQALKALTEGVARWRPETKRYYLSVRRSELASRTDWAAAAVGPAEVANLARELTQAIDYVDESHPAVLVVVEAIGDLIGTDADTPTLELVKALRRTGHLLIAEAETSAWTGSWGAALLNEIKAARRGLLLQPDQQDGETLLRTQLPRIGRDEYPPGRGIYVNRGRCMKVHLPLVG
jgi:S-DNA-T family DNA segregation ATPase FtsK/SpoIIIE